MNFIYKDNRVYLTDNNGTKIEQPFWENTYEPFSDYEDAKAWLINYLSKNLNTSILHFDIELKDNDTLIEDNMIAINKLYTLTFKESTQQLIGTYDITINIKDKNDNIIEMIKPVVFTDGEGSCEIIINEPGLMEIFLDNRFKIGEQDYLFVNDLTEQPVSLRANSEVNKLVYVIE